MNETLLQDVLDFLQADCVDSYYKPPDELVERFERYVQEMKSGAACCETWLLAVTSAGEQEGDEIFIKKKWGRYYVGKFGFFTYEHAIKMCPWCGEKK